MEGTSGKGAAAENGGDRGGAVSESILSRLAITPGEWERRRGPNLLVADRARINKRGQAVASRSKTGRNQVTAPIFLLVPQVKLPKRLDLDRDAARAHESLPGLIVANWFQV